MQFNSLDFMIFFPIVIAIYFVIPKKLRMVWLLVASYYFYMGWNAVYALLIGASTVITYLSGILFERINAKGGDHVTRNKKLVAAACIIINLGILGLFKYGNFFIESVNGVLGLFGVQLISYRFSFLLPVGISFYTFQALGYIIDVYRGEVEAEKNFIRYALFVSFFPQLVAGPIERSKNLLNQMRHIEEIRLWNAERVTRGAILMVWGLFMKMVIADRAAIIVDNVYNNYHMYGSTELILATVLFTFQIYCDFGSYSMIAIGAAKVMGFELMENFVAPMFSRSIAEFWRRWHISLSTWFRDYLYFPLGGSRKGRLRTYLNLFIVFMVSGLWHGAAWTYVIYGAIQGAYQIAGAITKPYRKSLQKKWHIKTEAFSFALIQIMGTTLLNQFAVIFFRANSLSDAVGIIRRIFVKPTPWLLFNGGIFTLGLDRPEMNILIVSILILIAVDLIRYFKGQMLDAFLLDQNLWFEWAVVIILILMIFVFGEYGPSYDAQQFIYFQF